MRVSEEMGNKLFEENQKLRKKIKALENERNFMKQCLYLALARTGFTLVIQNEPDDLPDDDNMEFDLDENVCHEMIIRAKRKKEDWEYWHR